MKSFLLALAILIFAIPASAAAPYQKSADAWSITTLQGRFLDNNGTPTAFGWYTELQPHLTLSPFPKVEQVESFVIPNYRLGDFAIGIGAGMISRLTDPIQEVRLLEQGSYNTRLESFEFFNRLRAEERFFAAKPFGLRFRLLNGIVWNAFEHIGITIWNDVFLNALSGNQVFDQDRLFVGPRFRVNKEVAIDVGYQPVFELKDIRHVAMVNLYINLNP